MSGGRHGHEPDVGWRNSAHGKQAKKSRDMDTSGVLLRSRCKIPHLLRERVEHNVLLT
jgi:hypothetical protein